MRTRSLFIQLLIFIGFLQGNASWADNNKGKQSNPNQAKAAQERRDDAKIKGAKEDVTEAQERLRDDAKEIREAESESAKTLAVVAETRQVYESTKDRVEAAQARRLGLGAAQTAQTTAQQAFVQATKPVLALLQTQAEYREAVKLALAAEQKIATAQQDQTLASIDRQTQVSAAQVAIDRLKRLEQDAFEKHPETRSLMVQRDAAYQKLSHLRAELREAVNQSSEVQAAERKWEQAKVAHNKSLERVAMLKQKIAADQAKLVKEKVELQKATLQDKANDQKPNTNQKKPNNSKK